MRKRIMTHFCALKNNKHSCARMQADFNIMGIDSFGAVVLTLCSGAWGLLCENKAISLLASLPSYNVHGVDFLGRANFAPDVLSKMPDARREQIEKARAAWLAA